MIAAVAVSPKAAKSLRSGNPWCYRTEVTGWPDAALARGEIVDVVDQQKNPIGQAFTASKSPLALRLLTRKPSRELKLDDAWWKSRLEAAWKRRVSLHGRDAFRFVHGESDLLPGLFLDRYGPSLTLQTLSEGADVRKEAWARLASEVTGLKTVVCRDDASGRDWEGLGREKRVLFGNETRVSYHEGTNRLEIDLVEDAKTGSFLDQLDNHVRAGELGRGEALDTFSYHGGFALALSTNCSSVIAVEQDEGAVLRARANVERNGRKNVTVEHANAFDVLRKFSDEGRQFDTVVVDPPGLAKRKEGIEAAKRAYHELNLRALKLLKPDGLLVSCSCSGKVTREIFEQILIGAAADAKRQIAVLERRGAGIDHPPLAALPQTEYLKAWFLRVL
ncbi:MAG: class I SAM-dependent rRNA methyltransferase [Archangium sp.]|nr:class I SAM-dependent rRNA methyltransferase [Archangium sp.]